MTLKNNLEQIRRRIDASAKKSGRDPSDITLIAVSKTVGIDEVKMAHELGVCDFGENRPQELRRKLEKLPQVRWHMIGRLQTNKVKEVVGRVKLIHSLDRWNLAEQLEKRGQLEGIEVPALLEVNISGETQKAGIMPADVEQFLKSMGQFSKLKIYGFMTMAPFYDDAELCRPVFRELAELKNKLECQVFPNVQLEHLSMGMSGDFEVAIEEGATLVRIGTAVFQE